MGLAEIAHSGWAVGVGRRLLDELAALIVRKAGRPGSLSGSDSWISSTTEAACALGRGPLQCARDRRSRCSLFDGDAIITLGAFLLTDRSASSERERELDVAAEMILLVDVDADRRALCDR
jgi:hypothetical protein